MAIQLVPLGLLESRKPDKLDALPMVNTVIKPVRARAGNLVARRWTVLDRSIGPHRGFVGSARPRREEAVEGLIFEVHSRNPESCRTSWRTSFISGWRSEPARASRAPGMSIPAPEIRAAVGPLSGLIDRRGPSSRWSSDTGCQRAGSVGSSPRAIRVQERLVDVAVETFFVSYALYLMSTGTDRPVEVSSMTRSGAMVL